MRRALAAAGTALLLACGLGACSDDGGVKAESSEPSAEVPGTDLPTDLPTEIATDLPTEIPTDLPTETESEVAPSGAGVDACSIVTPELVQSAFGIGDPGQVLPQPASLGDPDSTDCYFVGEEATIVVQATSRADQDLPESGYSYAGLPGAVEVPGADRGWSPGPRWWPRRRRSSSPWSPGRRGWPAGAAPGRGRQCRTPTGRAPA